MRTYLAPSDALIPCAGLTGLDVAPILNGTESCARARFRAPLNFLHFAGEHTAVVNHAMEGAMKSGERAALAVSNRLA